MPEKESSKTVFGDLSNKLGAPAKKSVFERQKAEAEAKRAREAAETAAIYEDFVKSFDDDGSSVPTEGSGAPRRSGPGSLDLPPSAPGGPGRRHFGGQSMRKSGPGSLGPPTSGFKREYDGSRRDNRKNSDRGLFAYEEDAASGPVDVAAAFKEEEEDEKGTESKAALRAEAKPTLQLSSLPPGTSQAVIRSLIPANLTVENIRAIPPTGPGSSQSTERKSMSAIVTLAADTPASDIDAAVTALQHRYLGYGFNLSLSRHLSSAALGSANAAANINPSLVSQPFGAQARETGAGTSMGYAPPPSSLHRGGFAPPSSYEQNQYARTGSAFEVQVAPPADIREVKLIHKTVEAVLSHGAEFEALLMTRPAVQKDEKWAWLWNPRSPGGVWYRWRLWQMVSENNFDAPAHATARRSHRLFEASHPWVEPEIPLRFEFATQLPELISDSDYHSSEEDESDDDDNPRKRRREMMHAGQGPPPKNPGDEEISYLNPMQRAKLIHLLSRLPNTNAKLRKGDVARVTAFAITHASQGASEVVDILVTNILRPLTWSKHANPDVPVDENLNTIANSTPIPETNSTATPDPKQSAPQQPDTSASTLIALYLISDILSASSTSGVRHAWRYRSLFESALLSRNVFPRIGRLEKDLGWGRLRAEKWRRSITGLLSLWEGWGVFMGGTHEKFMDGFLNPPATEEEKLEEERKKEEEERSKKKKSGWKSVAADEAVIKEEAAHSQELSAKGMEVSIVEPKDQEPAEAVGEAMIGDVDGVAMDDMDSDSDHDSGQDEAGQLGAATSKDANRADPAPAACPSAAAEVSKEQPMMSAGAMRRKRPTAADMFADSDEEMNQ